MSTQVANINLSAATVGQTGLLADWSQMLRPPTLREQMAPHAVLAAESRAATLVVYNESPCQLLLTLPDSRQTVTMPSGRWMQMEIPATDTQMTYTVQAIAPNSSTAPFNLILADLYYPGEPLDTLGVLGNSPVGVAGQVSTSSASSLKNDGNNAGTSIIETTPGDQGSSSMSIDNTGSGFWRVLSANVLRTVLNIVRGNSGTGKASIQFGDSGDPTITTIYASLQGAQPASVGTLSSTTHTVNGNVSIVSNSGWVITNCATVTGVSNADVAEWKDATTLADWFFIILNTSGDLIMWDNKNGRTIWQAVVASQQMIVPGRLVAGSANPTNVTTFEAAATNAQGNRVAQIVNSTVTATDNCDLLDLQRTTTHVQTFTFGIAPDSTFYIFDVGNGTFAGQGIFGSGASAGGGRIATMRSAGGGNAGQVLFEGTTDPAGNANEGDLWYGA